MKVRFKENACGFGFGYPEGYEAELPQKEAEQAVKYGCAVIVESEEVEKPKAKKAPKQSYDK